MSEIAGNKTVGKTKRIKASVKKIENPEGTITLNAALLVLQGKLIITKMGLRIAAVRDGFKSEYTGNGKEKFLLDGVKFKNWIKNTIDAIPDNFISIADAAKQLNVTTSYIYALVKKHEMETKKVGGGGGKIYIDFVPLKNIFDTKKKEG